MYSPATAPAATALSAEETLVSAKAKLAKQFSGDFDPRLSAIYIEPQGAERSNAPEAQTFPLLQEAAERLTRSPLRSLLLLGDSGMGKTCLSLHFCKKVWQWIDAGIPGLPLPLYIYLPQYKEYLHRGLLDQVLIEAKLTKAERHTLIEQPLLLILDGFDEVSIRENLYQTQGWGKRGVDIKILVTCRPEALVNQNPQALFEADELFGQNTAYFNTMYLQDFNENQIESYLSSYLKRSQSDGDEPRLSLRDYLDWLGRLPSLKALVSTPFLLTVVAQALPRIIEGLSSASPDEIAHKKLTQNAVFRHFLDHWFLKQAQRVKAQGKLKELSAEEVAGYMRAFAQNLASTRMRIDEGQLDEAPLKEEECLRLELIEPVHDKALLTLYRHVNPQKAQWRVFFSEDSQGQKIPHIDNIQAIRSGCLLHTVGEQFKFLHKSITEYLAAQELMEGVLGTSDHYLTTLLGEDGHAQGLNRVLLTKEPQMIKRLAEAANEYPDFKEALNKILLASKEISGLSIAAANAITILNYAGVDFSGRDLSEVQIPGADLTSGIFYGTNLSGANLANVILRQTYLSYADFRGSNLSNIEFGERPYWQVSSCIRCIAAYQASPDILHWLIGCRNGYVYRIDHHSGKQLAQLVHKDFFDSAKELLDFGYKEAVNALSIHSPSHLLATGGDNSKIWLWDLRNNKTLGCLTQHDEAIDAIVITSDGKVLVSASRWSDLTMILWSMPQGTPIRVLTSESIGDVCALAITPDVKTLISASRRTLQLWFLPEGTPGPVLCKNTYSSDKEINALVVTPNGKTLISGSKDVIQFWSLPEGTSGLALRGHTEKINTLVVTSDGKTLISVGEETFRLWSLSDGTLQLVVSKGRSWVTAANITSDGKTLVAGVDTTVRLWSICQQTFGPILVGHTGKINSLAITPDAKILIS
ncbi:MAG: Myosin heavy-chain kinase, partial [Gammaproteobacteria bacterium]|nr:Myosin heavy-chain kinase [Gammaproteobacteria bacterium]